MTTPGGTVTGPVDAEPELDVPRRTSPLAVVFGLASPDQLRTLIPLAVIALSSGEVLIVAAAIVVVLVVHGVLSWLRRTWCYADGVLHLDEGVLTRNQRRIPIDRMQHVEIERRLRHQIFDLAAVRVETAGGSGAELRLDAIPRREAEALRARVLAALRSEQVHDVAGAAASQPEVLVRLPPGRLLLAGVTGPEVAAILAALAVVFDTLIDIGVGADEVGSVQTSTFGVALLVLAAVPVWLGSAALVGLVRRWDLTATIEGDELRVSYGLLRKAEFVVKTQRVQDVRISRRLLLRPFNRADVRVRTAASGSGEQSRVDIPLLDDTEIERVLARVLPDAVPLPALRPAPAAARRRALVRGTAAGLVLALPAGLAGVFVLGPVGAVLLVAAPALGLWFGEAAYRGLGAWYGPEPRLVHSRTGALTRNRAIVPAGRVQSGVVVSTWFQRRRGLSTVRLDLAGGAVAVVDRAEPESSDLLASTL
ncbi:MAG: PH domain-containing protein [Acidimicrobiales bacterium]|nr:PH domain-containing protein [Acidimicrobiales bacterium]